MSLTYTKLLSCNLGHGLTVNVAIWEKDVQAALESLNAEFITEYSRGEIEPPSVTSPVSMVSLVGEGISESRYSMSTFFHALGAAGIPMLAMAAGAASRSISCIVPGADTNEAVRTIHAAFNLGVEKCSVWVLGNPEDTHSVIQQLSQSGATIAKRHAVVFSIVEVSRGDKEGIFHIEIDGAPSGKDLGDLER